MKMKKPESLEMTLEMVANVAIIITATMFSIVLVKSYWSLPPGTSDQTISPPIPEKLLKREIS